LAELSGLIRRLLPNGLKSKESPNLGRIKFYRRFLVETSNVFFPSEETIKQETPTVARMKLLPAPEMREALGLSTSEAMTPSVSQQPEPISIMVPSDSGILDSQQPVEAQIGLSSVPMARENTGLLTVCAVAASVSQANQPRYFFKSVRDPVQRPSDLKENILLIIRNQSESLPNHFPQDVLDCKTKIYEGNIDRLPYLGHTPEDLEKTERVSNLLAHVTHTTTDPDNKLALCSLDLNVIVAAIRKMKGEMGLAELATAILVNMVMEQGLYKQLMFYRNRSEFINRSEELLGISPSKIRDMNLRGKAFHIHQKDLIDGIEGEAGITLEELACKHLSKLTLYSKAVGKYGRVEALRRLKAQTFEEFHGGLKDANKRSQKPCTPKSDVSPDMTQYSAAEREFYRVISKGGYPCVVRNLTESQVQQVKTKLDDYHRRIMKEWYERHAHWHKPYDPANPLKIDNDFWYLNDIEDITRRIRAANSVNAPKRCSIAILMFRLSHEEALKSQWRDYQGELLRYVSFAKFSMEVLGFGEDYRDYVRVGRILWDRQYYRFLVGLDIHTDAMFYKLRYLDDAMKTHKSNEVLIYQRLQTLSVRDFALFSRNPVFESTFVKKLSKTKREKFAGLLKTLAENRNDQMTHIIELHNYDEMAVAHVFVNENSCNPSCGRSP
jgi:hypothetical protein